jgi:TM2 domain-containing membrane protein YozV
VFFQGFVLAKKISKKAACGRRDLLGRSPLIVSEVLSRIFECRFARKKSDPNRTIRESVVVKMSNAHTPNDSNIVWHIARGNERFGPFSLRQLEEMVASGRLIPSDMLWNPSLPSWQPASSVIEKGFPPPLPAMPNVPSQAIYGVSANDPKKEFIARKLVAGILGIVFGSLGIHKFVLGLNQAGAIMLATTLACTVLSILILPAFGALAMWVIGIVEGVMYLSKSDEEFYQSYAVQKKAWF